MDGYRSTETSRTRRPRIGLLIVGVLLGLIAGVALTVFTVRRVAWFGMAGPTTTTTVTRSGASDFVPAQPLGPGESAATQTTDPAVLATREATLAAQIASLESRLAGITVDAGAASGQAGRAESMLVAVAVRRAIDHGTPLGYLEEQLRARFGQTQPRAVAILVQAARVPVTRDSLRAGLDAIDTTLATGRGDAHWSDTLDRLLSNLVILRRAGTPSPLPVDRLAIARQLIDTGQIDAARQEVMQLPGAGNTASWLAAARRYVTAHQALDAIDTAAIMVPAPAGAATSSTAMATTPATTTTTTAAVPPIAAR